MRKWFCIIKVEADTLLKEYSCLHLIYIYSCRLACDSKPVCIYPASITQGVLALTYKSHLGSYPFALAQSKEIACILVALAV
jgi:hypothetical protein